MSHTFFVTNLGTFYLQFISELTYNYRWFDDKQNIPKDTPHPTGSIFT